MVPRGRGATFLPTAGQNGPVSKLPRVVGVVDVWLDETFSRQPSAHARSPLPGVSRYVYCGCRFGLWAAELHVSDASTHRPWSLRSSLS